MPRVIVDARMPPLRISNAPRNNRLTAALALGVVALIAGFAVPSSGMSSVFIDQSVPQIVTVNGP